MTLLHRETGRAYFALQALAGALWWVLVPTVPAVRTATLGRLDPLLVGALDVPLFVVASALAALGIRWALWVLVPWTLLVTTGMAILATLTGEAGWGVVAMIAASAGSLLAGMLVLWDEVPTRRVLIGPLAFRPARRQEGNAPLIATVLQLLVFWTLFLVVLPVPMTWLERRWQVAAVLAEPVRTAAIIAGVVLLGAAAGLSGAAAGLGGALAGVNGAPPGLNGASAGRA